MLLHSYIVAKNEAKQTVAAFLRAKLDLSWSKTKQLIEKKQVRVAGHPTGDPALRLKAGNRVEVHGLSALVNKKPPKALPKKPAGKPRTTWAGPAPVIVYEDGAIVVVDKPAGLTTMRHAEEAAEFGDRGKRFLPTTLADLLPDLLGQPGKRLRAVHRIDRDTSGLVVFARTAEAEQLLNDQFREHSIERRYLALVRGRPKPGRIESHFVRDRGDGRRGSVPGAECGMSNVDSTMETQAVQRAVTHVKIVEEFGGFTLVECRLETGRTHQVRIHLGELGTPLCGEKVYDRPPDGKPFLDESGAARPMLHAVKLGLNHPDTDEKISWSCALPEDMNGLLARLRSNPSESGRI